MECKNLSLLVYLLQFKTIENLRSKTNQYKLNLSLWLNHVPSDLSFDVIFVFNNLLFKSISGHCPFDRNLGFQTLNVFSKYKTNSFDSRCQCLYYSFKNTNFAKAPPIILVTTDIAKMFFLFAFHKPLIKL